MGRPTSNPSMSQQSASGPMLATFARLTSLSAVVAAACLMLVMISQYGRLAPINDEILQGNGADIAIKAVTGDLQLADLFTDYRGYLLVPNRCHLTSL